MRTKKNKHGILFIGTFPPKKCGIASFTYDLATALSKESGECLEINICALDTGKNLDMYNFPVTHVMDSNNLGDYQEMAKKINQDPLIKLVCIEHEFGLFGGNRGNYILMLTSLLEKPSVLCFHTILPDPDSGLKSLIRSICEQVSRVVVMTYHSAKLLEEDYGIHHQKIKIIPHGTHLIESDNPAGLKKKYGLDKKLVLTTFGLLSPNKGIKTGIRAMAHIVKKFPEALYLVLGRTHPNLIAEEGESYRESLQKMIRELNLSNNVRLVNEYLPTQELMEHLVLTDLYLFTSRDPYQAVSGTFIYAMSAGCPIISNSFVLADEMLGDGKGGIIIPSGNEEELAEKAIYLLKHPQIRERMGSHAFNITRNTIWKNVAQQHAALFNDLLKGFSPITGAPSEALTTDT